MLVEIYEENGFWCFKDNMGITCPTHFSNSIQPMEGSLTNNKDDLKKVIKLKEAGFTSEEIIEMSKEGVV